MIEKDTIDMSNASPERPSRRAASRRKVVLDEEDSSDIESSTISRRQEESEEEEFTPAPKNTRASPRRRTAASTAATPRTSTARRTRASESVEPSQIFSPPQSEAGEPLSPTKKAAPKRRSVKDARAARKSRVSIAPDAPELPPLPTPQPSESPEATPRQPRQTTPLADITESTINEQTPRPASRQAPSIDENASVMEEDTQATVTAATPKAARTEVKKVDAQITHLEKPMDIVVRTRALGVPQSQEPVEPKSRMTITYLTLMNFKSYAGKQMVGPFHSSFSSVVGPNGSGKSNVIDSLLFVFGFRASKMRQGKISALIHNSAQFPDLDFCEVEVHFNEVMDEPNGGSTVIPG